MTLFSLLLCHSPELFSPSNITLPFAFCADTLNHVQAVDHWRPADQPGHTPSHTLITHPLNTLVTRPLNTLVTHPLSALHLLNITQYLNTLTSSSHPVKRIHVTDQTVAIKFLGCVAVWIVYIASLANSYAIYVEHNKKLSQLMQV